MNDKTRLDNIADVVNKYSVAIQKLVKQLKEAQIRIGILQDIVNKQVADNTDFGDVFNNLLKKGGKK